MINTTYKNCSNLITNMDKNRTIDPKKNCHKIKKYNLRNYLSMQSFVKFDLAIF